MSALKGRLCCFLRWTVVGNRKLLICITDLRSLVLMANFEFVLAAQTSLVCVEQHSLIAGFYGSWLTWRSVWLQSWGFVDTAVLVQLLYPLCAEAGLFLCVVVPGLAFPVSLPAHKGLGRCGRKQWSLHHHFLRTASHQGCSVKEKVELHESNNVLGPGKTNTSILSAVSLI